MASLLWLLGLGLGIVGALQLAGFIHVIPCSFSIFGTCIDPLNALENTVLGIVLVIIAAVVSILIIAHSEAES